jgi:acetyl esterase/lipase
VCSAATHRVLAARVADTISGVALVPDYRLAPEAPFPTAVDDGVAVLRWLRRIGVPPQDTVIAGDSAGGNLALTVTLALREADEPLPAAVVTVSPWTDLTLSGGSLVSRRDIDPFAHMDDLPRMRDLYLQGGDPASPLASPLFADLSGLPPVLAVVGDTETMFDDSARLVDAIERAGGTAHLAVIEGGFHTWLNFAGVLPEADAGLEIIGAFLRSASGDRWRRTVPGQ